MQKFDSPLDNVRVSAPCPADWNEMNGDERIRFCNQCQLNVYNLSEMTRQEAERLLREREGRLCVRFYRRADGTIITENCPKGLAALKRRVTRTATAVFSSVLAFISGIGVYTASLGINLDIIDLIYPVENIEKVVEEPYSVTGIFSSDKEEFSKKRVFTKNKKHWKRIQIKKRRGKR